MAKRSIDVPDGTLPRGEPHPTQSNRNPAGTMSEPGDIRHQQHSYPAHVTSDDRDGARDEAGRWVRRKRIF
jgi:hypothetical protein